MKKLDGTRLGDKKSLNINLILKKIALFQQKKVYIAEEVGDCQISDTKSFIFNKTPLIFNTKKRLFLTKSLILKNRFNSTKRSFIFKNTRFCQQKSSFNLTKKSLLLKKTRLFSTKII